MTPNVPTARLTRLSRGGLKMRSLKSSWKVCLGVASGFVLGVLVSHMLTVKAQGAKALQISTLRVEAVDMPMKADSTQYFGQMIGFSCVPAASLDLKAGYTATCYIATK